MRARQPRGAEPRWWEDVNEGDDVGPLTKGPLTVTDMVCWHVGMGTGMYGVRPLRLAWRNRQRIPRFYTPNEHGVPDVQQRVHWEPDAARNAGNPTTFDYGRMRETWLIHLCTDWMGDDGWLWKARLRIPAVQLRRRPAHHDRHGRSRSTWPTVTARPSTSNWPRPTTAARSPRPGTRRILLPSRRIRADPAARATRRRDQPDRLLDRRVGGIRRALMHMSYDSVGGLRAEQRRARYCALTFDRADQRNAVNDVMLDAMIEQLAAAGIDESVRVIRIDAEGPDFCAGADLIANNAKSERKPRVGSTQRRLPNKANRLIPVDARDTGAHRRRGARAGPRVSASTSRWLSDFCLAADDARFWEPFMARGFTPDSGAAWLLPRLIGMVRTRQLLMLGEEISGATAAEWGIIHGRPPGTRTEMRGSRPRH